MSKKKWIKFGKTNRIGDYYLLQYLYAVIHKSKIIRETIENDNNMKKLL